MEWFLMRREVTELGRMRCGCVALALKDAAQYTPTMSVSVVRMLKIRDMNSFLTKRPPPYPMTRA
jgi:hypothetical protein